MKLSKKHIFITIGFSILVGLLKVQAFAHAPVVDVSDVGPYVLENKPTTKRVIGAVETHPIGSCQLRGACGGPIYYSQKDPQWSGACFGGYTFGGTGCVPTCIAMLMGETPLSWGEELYNAKLYNGGAGGNAVIYAGKKANKAVKPIYSESQLRESLEFGWGIIALCDPPISLPGYSHAVVVYGLHGDLTNVLDPLENRVTGKHPVQEVWNARSSDPVDMGDEGSSLYAVSGSFLENEFLPVFRVYNPIGNRHLYTTNSHERDDLVSRGWHDEGVAFKVLLQGVPIYRVYDKSTGEHLYTANSFERDKCVSNGWDDEGIAFYVLGLGFAEGEGIPVYRMCNERGNHEHMYTTNYEEIVKATQELGWRYEGIAFRVPG